MNVFIFSEPGGVKRMRSEDPRVDPCDGTVVWSPIKSLWFTAHALIALGFCVRTFSPGAAALFAGFTALTLCLGHSIGLHRLLIHRSFACPRGLEWFLVHLGVVVGMGGPRRMLYLHEIRDWAQRHAACHPFFSDQGPIGRDFLWQLHGEMRLVHPPRFVIEPRVADDPFYRFMDRTWMLQQLPWALLCYALGGWGFVVWGISLRITVSLIGHWLVGYLAHNTGTRTWHLDGHAVQGYNVPLLGLLTMGESWHNNHHAFPESARLGQSAAQVDPGWWALWVLRALGFIWDVRVPENLPPRPERRRLAP
jgi:stearoyl-CoA desaturase (delta-9 desaturase)